MQRLVSSHPIRARDERHSFAGLAVMDMTDQPEIPCSSNNGSAQRPKRMAKMNGEDRGPRVAVQKHANSLQKIQKSLKRNLDCGRHPFEQKSPSTLRLRQKNPP